MKRSGKYSVIFILLCCLSMALFLNHENQKQGKDQTSPTVFLSKEDVESIWGRMISDEEWNKMTNDGSTPIIGAADQAAPGLQIKE